MSEPSAPDSDHVVICWACGWARVARSHAAAVNRATTHGCQARPDIVSAAAYLQLARGDGGSGGPRSPAPTSTGPDPEI